MIKFSICNEMFEGWEWPDICELAAKLGYDAVEIAPYTLADSVTDISPERRQEIRKAAESHGLEIAGLHWLLVKPEGLYVNHPDAQIRAKTRDYFLALIDFCGDLGGKIMVIGSPKQRNVYEGLTYEQAWEYARETFAALVDLAKERRVTLCLEPLTINETNMFVTAAETVKMIEQINHPNFRLILDVKAMSGGEQEPPAQVIRANAKYLAHVHANDANLRHPGSGDTDFVPIAAALKEIGYDGYLSIEVFDFKPGPETIATEGIKYLKEVFKQ